MFTQCVSASFPGPGDSVFRLLVLLQVQQLCAGHLCQSPPESSVPASPINGVRVGKRVPRARLPCGMWRGWFGGIAGTECVCVLVSGQGRVTDGKDPCGVCVSWALGRAHRWLGIWFTACNGDRNKPLF